MLGVADLCLGSDAMTLIKSTSLHGLKKQNALIISKLAHENFQTSEKLGASLQIYFYASLIKRYLFMDAKVRIILKFQAILTNKFVNMFRVKAMNRKQCFA